MRPEKGRENHIYCGAALMSVVKYFLVLLSELKSKSSPYCYFSSPDAMDVLIYKLYKIEPECLTLLFIFFLEIT